MVAEASSADRAQVFDLGFARGFAHRHDQRDDAFVVPQGSTQLVAQDKVLVLADDEALSTIRARIEGDEPS